MKPSHFTTNILLTSSAIAVGVLVSWFAASGSETTIHGTVQLDGRQVPFARVIFVPDDSDQTPISTTADQDGHYTLSGMMSEGSYRVMVEGQVAVASGDSRLDELDDYQKQMIAQRQMDSSTTAGQEDNDQIPPGYFSVTTSPLTTTIAPGMDQQFDLQLRSNFDQLARNTGRNSTVR